MGLCLGFAVLAPAPLLSVSAGHCVPEPVLRLGHDMLQLHTHQAISQYLYLSRVHLPSCGPAKFHIPQ